MEEICVNILDIIIIIIIIIIMYLFRSAHHQSAVYRGDGDGHPEAMVRSHLSGEPVQGPILCAGH